MKNDTRENVDISVVVCIYNGDRTLNDTISSLLEQNYSMDKYEIILVNDGSNDNSELICRDFIEVQRKKIPKLTYIYQENTGLGGARNTGIFLS